MLLRYRSMQDVEDVIGRAVAYAARTGKQDADTVLSWPMRKVHWFCQKVSDQVHEENKPRNG